MTSYNTGGSLTLVVRFDCNKKFVKISRSVSFKVDQVLLKSFSGI